MTKTVTQYEIELMKLTEKNNLTKEYLRRALLKLKKSTEFFDIEEDGVDEFEEGITKFITEVKSKNIV
jgi:hypothetical protein